MNAIEKYNKRIDQIDSLVCVGLDSDYTQLPEQFMHYEYPQFTFNRWIIDQTHIYTSAYKPNIAFYEARGDRGMMALKLTLEYLHQNHPDILTICDAKRGDNGVTSLAYVSAIFDWFGFDSLTLHSYLGKDSLAPYLKRTEKGCIIVCRTSNPSAGELQDLLVDGKPLWHIVAEKVRDEWNQNGNCMLVMGATYPDDLRKAREIAGEMTFLIPGVGAQGGDIEQTVKAGLNSAKKGMIISSSRGIIFANNPGEAAKELRDEINQYR